MVLYFNVLASYPDCGNCTPAIASESIDLGIFAVIWYDGNELEAV